MYEKLECQNAISEYLSTATRHTFDIKLDDFKPFVCDVFVKITHRIEIEVEEKTSAKANKNILMAADYIQEIIEQILQQGGENE